MSADRYPGSFSISMAGRSDVGRVRTNNEDYLDWDIDRGLAVLADGVGGRNAGEVASRMAVTTLLEQVPALAVDCPAEHCVKQLRHAIGHANKRIYESSRHPPFTGMSTTLTALLLCGKQAVLAHVGDSRIYRLRNGRLAQVTVDHSLVQEMIDSGVMSMEEATASTNRHVITRALGLKENIDIDVTVTSLRAGDRFLLCSDGLSDMLDEEALASLLTQEDQTLAQIVDVLIEEANLKGGKDNIAALVVAVNALDGDYLNS